MNIKPLRVLFDAYELAPGAGKSMGIYNYAKNLLHELALAGDQSVQLIVACNTACAADFQPRRNNVRVEIIGAGAPGKLARQLWLRGGAALQVRKQCADIYFSPKGFLPNGVTMLSPRAKSVVVVHDLIPLWYADHFPGHFGWLEELVVNRSLIRSACKADRVIAISQATAMDIQTRLGRSKDVIVVHNGVPICAPGDAPIEGPYIFAVSSGLPHKNASGLIEAYRQYRELAKNPLPLVLCGVAQPEVDGIHAMRGLSDAEMHGCYAHARLFVFLSRIEGFGFPPLEAMSHGTEVLCSDIPALREVTHGAAYYVPPDEPQAVCAKLLEILDRPAPDRDLVSKTVKAFSWDTCAKGVLAVLQDHSKKESA